MLAPAAPDEGRTVRDGRVLVDGVGLEDSNPMNDPRSPPFIGDLGAALAPLPVRIPDADDQDALDRIASTAPSDALWVGAARLAGALAAAGDALEKPWSTIGHGARVVFVVGSAHPRAEVQIKALEEAGFGPALLARPACRADPLTVQEALAAHAVSVIDIRRPDIVAVSGGETALALIKALRVGSLRVLGQPMLGICAATMAYGDTSLLFLTKAGGFGREAVLVDLASKFGLRVAI
ncbi:MAG: hypothetical protein JJ920_20565 [Roseitalea sp.]|nr:hypothetical protein [Roseitalea sp.]MBO6723511.1 hypothetical protein [Roseitalea sp.]MBO6745307.1 hypothetical protein [Roseitalea sp.]